MGRMDEEHRALKNGVGKCSVPMWCNGLPAGFCDKPAYGKPPETEMYRDGTGRLRRADNRYDGYVPALACPTHGGPTLQEILKGKIVIRFDGPPSPEASRFVEVEKDGRSINAGTWIQDGDDWLLVLNEGR